MPRFHCPMPLASGAELALPAGAARHVQVLRLQPGSPVTLFNGDGGEFEATVAHMGRSEVRVRVGPHHAVERESTRTLHLAVGLMASERMDWLVEKATELGAASIQPLLAERSVLRLNGERAEKKRSHWQAVAAAACEQCGRNRVPVVHAVHTLDDWLAQLAADGAASLWVLSLAAQAQSLDAAAAGNNAIFLSGPEGGLSSTEEARACAIGFRPTTLGPRILRAETAPLAALSRLA